MQRPNFAFANLAIGKKNKMDGYIMPDIKRSASKYTSTCEANFASNGKVSHILTLTICFLCILTICNISYFPFWFEGWIWALIASVPDLCILFTFTF